MKFNGTLHEHLLADVLQLLAQQKANGRLEVRNGNRVGFIMLSEGMIALAQEDDQTVVAKAANGLRALGRAPERELRKLLATHLNHPARFFDTLLSKQWASKEEVNTFVRVTTEDLACNLFGWHTGTYRFESMNTVRSLVVPGLVMPADAVVMEAMRREDEAKRLFGSLSDESIFVPTSREHDLGGVPDNCVELLRSPDAYVLSAIDGLTSVGMITRQSCLCHYRVMESLVRLWQSNVAAPLPAELSQTIEAAKRRKPLLAGGGIRKPALAVGGSLLAAIVIVFLGAFVFQRVLMRNKAVQSSRVRTEIEVTESAQKRRIAELQYAIEHGSVPVAHTQLISEELLAPRDVAPLLQIPAVRDQ